MKSFLRGLVFAVAPTALIFGAAELALRAAGESPNAASTSRGFDDAATYIGPDSENPGSYRTFVFPDHLQHKEVRIPPKGASKRVVLLGGSNTESFPETLLERELERLDPERAGGYEVVNLGRQGYGSARVAILFEQALILEPDVVVIYSGHNEFIELDFQLELAALEQDATPVQRVLQRTAVFTALENRFAPKDTWGSGEEPTTEPVWQHEQTRDFTFQQTLERFASYRRNLELMLDLANRVGAEVVLCTPVGNELAMPLGWGLPASFSEDQASAYKHKRQAWLKRLPEPMSVFIPPTGRDRIKHFAWSLSEDMGNDLANVPQLRGLADPFADEPPYLQSPDRWVPQLFEKLTVQDRFFHAPLEDSERSGLGRFLTDAESFLEQVPDDPMVQFGRGIALLRLGRGEEAAEALHAAAARDRGPQSANDTSNQIVRALAAANPDLRLFDSQALYRERSPDGIIGYELLRDECHLHTLAYQQLMRDLAPYVLGN